MQEAQETDLETMEALYDLFESFVQVENAASAAQMQRNLSSSSASSSSGVAVAVEETKANERAITPETLTLARARDILMGQIKQRILYRENLMMRLQNKTDSVKAIEQQAEQQSRPKFNNSDFRMRYRRAI